MDIEDLGLTEAAVVDDAPPRSDRDDLDGADLDGADLDALLQVDHPRKLEVAAWARDALADGDVIDRDRSSEFWLEGFRRCAERGLQAATVPAAYGGRELSLVDAVLEYEGLGLGCRDNGLAFALTCQTWAMQHAFLIAANDEQRSRFLPGLVSGTTIGSFAMTELDAGSDSYSISTTASAVDGGYVLNGRKAFVTLGSVSDVTIVFATTDPALGRWGITAFLVEHSSPGVKRLPTREKMGLRTTPFCDLELNDVVVPEANRLGNEGSGGSLFGSTVEAERAFLFACQLGLMERQLDETVAFSRDREQFGQPIGNFQAVSHRIAEMKLRHEAARLLLYKTAILHRRGRSATLEAALTKLAITEGAVASGLDAIAVHGARGYLTSHGVERDVRDVLGSTIYSGTSDVQRNVIARLLGATR